MTAATQPKFGTIEYDVKEIQDRLQKLLARDRELNKKLETTNPSFKPLVEYKGLKYPEWYSAYTAKDAFEFPNGKSSGWGYSPRPRTYVDREAVMAQVEKFKQQLAELLESARPTYEENAVIIAHNRMVADRIRTFMTTCGIKPTYEKRDEKSRARIPKYYSTRAGYEDDITRTAKTGDPTYYTLTAKIKQWTDSIDKYAVTLATSVEDEARRRHEEERSSKKALFFAAMRVKYKLPFDAGENAIGDAINVGVGDDAKSDWNIYIGFCPDYIEEDA